MIDISKVRSCKVGTMPECVQLYRCYKLRLGLLVRYRPLHIEATSRYGLVRLMWEPREKHWALGIVEDVHKSGYFRISRL